MINMRTSTDAGSAWRPCNDEVGHLVRKLRVQRHVTQIRAATLLALLGVVAFSGHCYYPAIARQMEIRMPGGCCERYQTQMEHFYCDRFNHSPADLDPEFWIHLAHCPDCKAALRFYTEIAHPAIARSNRPVLNGKRVDLPASSRSISFNEMPGHSLLAVGR
jgi:hypothetical protein